MVALHSAPFPRKANRASCATATLCKHAQRRNQSHAQYPPQSALAQALGIRGGSRPGDSAPLRPFSPPPKRFVPGSTQELSLSVVFKTLVAVRSVSASPTESSGSTGIKGIEIIHRQTKEGGTRVAGEASSRERPPGPGPAASVAGEGAGGEKALVVAVPGRSK